MNESILIREAVPADYERVLELITELAVFEKEPEAVIITVEDLINGARGDYPLFTCYVAVYNGVIEGMALCYFRFSTWKGKSVHLEDLIVSEKMRGKGLGKKLYDRVMQYAFLHGVKRVEWVVLEWNTPAIKFYEKSGAKIIKDWYLAQMDEVSLKNYLDKL